MASGDGSFKFRFSNKGGASAIKEEIRSKFDRAGNEFKGKVKKTFGSAFVRDDMFETGIVFKNRDKMMKGGGKVGNPKMRKELVDIYSDAWEERYEEFQKAHREYSPPKTPHQKYKEKNLGKPAYHTDKKIKYSEHTKWTGLMYESVMEAFQDGGSQYLSVANLLITGGFKMNPDQYDSHYFEKFTPWFRSTGILKGDIVELSGSRWSDISNMMTRFVKKGFVQPLVQVLNNLEMKV